MPSVSGILTGLYVQILDQALSSKFVRNVAIVATGTAGAQAITMAFSPINTRLYGPEAFGILGTFTAPTVKLDGASVAVRL